MPQTKRKKPTKAELQRKVEDLEAQLASSYHFADIGLGKAVYPEYMGSAVVMQIRALGGHSIVDPVAIRDGLSVETVEAIKADLKRSYGEATILKPSGPKAKT